jgi:SAM-dependent methyltransferase
LTAEKAESPRMKDEENLEAYAARQRKFWNTHDEREATFARVDTVSEGDEVRYQALAEGTGELLIKDVVLPANPILMEIGCGVGRLIRQMQKRIQFSKLYGIDISETMIGYTRKNTGGDPRLSLHVNTGYDLGMLPDASVDYAYSVDVFIHIFDSQIIQNYMNEVHRILKPRGYFRFDVRHLDLDKMFGTSVGGRWARFLYSLGLKRADTHRWQPGEAAEFNGNKFRDVDLRKSVEKANLKVLNTFVRPEDTHLWCLAQKD